MWRRLGQRLRQRGLALATAVVLAIAVVDRRTLLPLQVAPIVLRVDAPPVPPPFLRMRSVEELLERLWLN